MPKFESPLGKQSIPERPMKHLSIPDESGFTAPPPPNPQPMGGGFSPSVSRRVGRPMTEEEMAEWQARMQESQDPDNSLSEVEREFKRARQEKARGVERLNDGARKRIEMLTDMTRTTRTADIGGQTYKLQTLKGREMRDAISAASEYDGTVHSPYEIRKQLLGRSLVVVAGVDIASFIGSNELDARLNAVEDMDDALLNRLYDEYLAMVKDARDRYSIKTEEDVKEVIEDLKK
jgi:hypothetical protein